LSNDQKGRAVLVQGETGTGKEVIAQAIHDSSRRRQHRFVPVNCAAIPASRLQSELLGRERGAFTGAVTRRAGLDVVTPIRAAPRSDLFVKLPVSLTPQSLA